MASRKRSTEKVAARPIPPKPTIEVKDECTYCDDENTTNVFVLQKVTYGQKNGFRFFVRPDELHDEPDSQWDEHEPDDLAALGTLFKTYGKGDGTEIRVKLNVNEQGKFEYFLDVRLPKPTTDEDVAYPKVCMFRSSDGAMELYEEVSPETSEGFVSRKDLEGQLEMATEELDPIAAVLNEFDMPGDLPPHLYEIPERLYSIFRAVKERSK